MKKEIRKEFKQLRDNLSDKAFLDAKITDAFLSSDLYKNADSVLLYFSAGSEVSTEEIFKACLADGKTAAFPVCLDENGKMDFFAVESAEDLGKGMYGIMAPKSSCKRFVPMKKSLCIVPGLSFDKNGYRLGYGKGYYDRYLADFSGTSCGLCYEALVSESLPVNSYDKKVNCLITDKKTYNFNSKEDLKNG